MLEIDRYAYQSRWREVNPVTKTVAYIVLLLVALCSISYVQLVILLILAPMTCYVTRISFKRYCHWMMVPFTFLMVSVLGILLSFTWDKSQLLLSFPLGSLYMGISADSVIVAKNAFLRSLACLAVTYLFVLTTPFDQLIRVGKKARIPNVLLEVILLTYRFIFIFLDEMVAIKKAQTLRFGYISFSTSYRSLGMLISMLLSRVLIRYNQMTIALESKLYQGDFHL